MKMSPTVMEGVREYNEELPVELGYDEDNDRLCIISRNEAGYNGTYVDLQDLMLWLKKHNPEYIKSIFIGGE